jgi:hypothetical protein
MGFEGEAYALGVTVDGEAELREQPPEAAPATGQDAGPRGDGGVEELEKYVDENVVRKRAEAVLAVAAIGEIRSLGRDLPVAALHGGRVSRRVSARDHICSLA